MVTFAPNSSLTSTATVTVTNLPAALTNLDQWVVWKYERGRKIPYSPKKQFRASATNPAHWSDYRTACAARDIDGFDGIGFVFHENDAFVGVDLDNCRNDVTGEVAEWAQEIIDDFDSYTEVSPSGTGVKIFCQGTLPLSSTGKRAAYSDGAVEMYHHGRYFTVTGEAVPGNDDVKLADDAIKTWFPKLYGSAAELARQEGSTAELEVPDVEAFALGLLKDHLGKLPQSVSGQRGSDAMIHLLCEIRRMRLNGGQSWELIHWVNQNMCVPPWDQSELERKWGDAKKMENVTTAEDDFEVIREASDGAPVLAGWDTGLVCWSGFRAADYTVDFMVEDVLAQSQPFIIGGMQKSLKTGLAMDLCVSLATGTPFLGHFDTPQPRRVAIFSGESGGSALQRRGSVIAQKRGIDPTDPLMDNLFISLQSPKFGQKHHLLAIHRAIVDLGIEFCLVDPAYLSVLNAENASSAGNNYAMGDFLERYNECGKATGCAMGLVHHMSKGGGKLGKSSWPHLGQLSMAGYAEWTRQWVLVSRAADMVRGKHELKATIGGSEGHGGNFLIKIDEGYDDRRAGGDWSVEVIDANETPEEEFERVEKQAADKQGKDHETDERVLAFLEDRAEGDKPWASANQVRNALGVGWPAATASLQRLQKSCRIQSELGKRRGKDCDLYQALPF